MHRALLSSSPVGTELQSCDIISIDLMKVKVNAFNYCYRNNPSLLITVVNELLNISVGLSQKEIGELDEHDNLIILTEVIPVFAGKQTTPLAE